MSKRILLITKSAFFDIDKIGATVVLAKILAGKHQSQSEVFVDFKIDTTTLNNIIDTTAVKFVDSFGENAITISLDSTDIDPEKVEWEVVEGKLQIKLQPILGKIPNLQPKVTQEAPSYDLVAALGIKTLEEMVQLLGNNEAVWANAGQTLNIDLRSENRSFGDANFLYPELKTFAQAVVRFAVERQLEISAANATELLSCIYWKTNSLRNRYTDSSVLSTVQQLLEMGADLNLATTKIYSSLSLVEIKARQEAYQNLTVHGSEVVTSFITKDTARQLYHLMPVSPHKNPLFAFRDAKASFTMLPIGDKETLVFASAKDDKFNLKRWFGQYHYVGDPQQAELTFPMDIKGTQEALINTVEKHLNEQSETIITNTPAPTTTINESGQQTHQASEIIEENTVAPVSEYDPLAPAKSFAILTGEEDDKEVSEEDLLEMMGPFIV